MSLQAQTERTLDPTSKDYVLDGDFERRGDLLNEIYKRVTQIKGEAVLEPNVGRPRRERLKDIPGHRTLLLQDIREALQPMIDGGRAESVTVAEVQPRTPRGPGWMFVYVEAVTAAGDSVPFETWLEVA